MGEKIYPKPESMRRTDGTARFAFITLLMLNDSYLPGALMAAHGLRQQQTGADLVCLVSADITPDARHALHVLFDHVIDVEKIFLPDGRTQQRQFTPFVLTRYHALRLGKDGDLGLAYEKIALLDADLLPLRHYDHLFTLKTPAGILNEKKGHFLDYDKTGAYRLPQTVQTRGTWNWHRCYGKICPHGHPIPKRITDRIRQDPSNMGIHGALFVLAPSMQEFRSIQEEMTQSEVRRFVGETYAWPDMQYLTLRWSGRWTNIDLRFGGFRGYPNISVLFGTHYAGFKPWQISKIKALRRYGRYEDFRYWFKQYDNLLIQTHPELQKNRRLKTLHTALKPFQK